MYPMAKETLVLMVIQVKMFLMVFLFFPHGRNECCES